MGELLRNLAHLTPPVNPSSREFTGELRIEPADARARLEEVRGREGTSGQEIEDVSIHQGPNGLHEIRRERVPKPLVVMHYTDVREHPDRLRGDDRFGLDEGV